MRKQALTGDTVLRFTHSAVSRAPGQRELQGARCGAHLRRQEGGEDRAARVGPARGKSRQSRGHNPTQGTGSFFPTEGTPKRGHIKCGHREDLGPLG